MTGLNHFFMCQKFRTDFLLTGFLFGDRDSNSQPFVFRQNVYQRLPHDNIWLSCESEMKSIKIIISYKTGF